MTALARQQLSRTEQAGLLARAALSVAAERMGGRPPEPFLEGEDALQARIIKETRRRLKIAPDDVSDEALRAIEDELDAEMEAVAEPVDEEAALARASPFGNRDRFGGASPHRGASRHRSGRWR